MCPDITTSKAHLFRFTTAAIVVSYLSFSVVGQELQRVNGYPLPLPGGQLAIVVESDDGLKLVKMFGHSDKNKLDLMEGDLVVGVNKDPVTALKGLREAISKVSADGLVKVRIQRGDRMHDVEFPKTSGAFSVPPSAMRQNTESGGWQTRPETAAQAQPSEPTKNLNNSEVETLVQNLLNQTVTDGQPGMTVAVWRAGLPVVSASKGMADIESGVAMQSDTMLPVDSLAKQFTAFCLASLVASGKLSLDDDVRKLLPELSGINESITLNQLLTHTSGLRDYTGLLALTGWQHGQPVTSDQILVLISRQTDLQFEPGTQHRYSNTNYALLPIIVEKLTGKRFEDWMRHNVFVPLGMNSSSFPLGNEAIPNVAKRYFSDDETVRVADQRFGLTGSSGMVSTAVDLVRWARAMLDADMIDNQIVAMMTAPAKLKDGTEIKYGMGIGVSDFRGVRRFSHSGSSKGSASILHIYPDQKLAISVLSNLGKSNVSSIAKQLAESLLVDELQDQTDAASLQSTPGAIFLTDQDLAGEGYPDGDLSAEDISRLSGRYLLDDDRELVFEAGDGCLLIKLADGIAGVPLIHLGNRRFRFRPARWELSFEQSTGPAQTVTLHLTKDSISRTGTARDIPGVRKTTRKLNVSDLRRFVGQYMSSELGVVYRIILRNNKLFLEHPRLGRLELSHQSNNRFEVAGNVIRQIRFHSDDSTRVAPIVSLTATAVAWSSDASFTKLPINKGH